MTVKILYNNIEIILNQDITLLSDDNLIDLNILNNLNLLNNINFFKFIDINNILFHPLFTIERTDDHIIVTDYKIIKF